MHWWLARREIGQCWPFQFSSAAPCCFSLAGWLLQIRVNVCNCVQYVHFVLSRLLLITSYNTAQGKNSTIQTYSLLHVLSIAFFVQESPWLTDWELSEQTVSAMLQQRVHFCCPLKTWFIWALFTINHKKACFLQYRSDARYEVHAF